MEQLRLDSQTVKIDKGELVSYSVDGHEYIHQKGSPGWRNSDTEMFPIIGPTAEAGFMVQTPKGSAVQDQHGLLRELEYTVEYHFTDIPVCGKKYEANTKIKNSKYPDKSEVGDLYWPYDFKFQKTFRLEKDGLHITFTVEGAEGMPFMLGYHPAFKLHSENITVEVNGNKITIPEILEVGSRALQVPDCTYITLKDTRNLMIKTEGFGHFMLWTEVPNMLCIEPITFYPYTVQQHKLHEGFRSLDKGNNSFKVDLFKC